MLDLDSIKASTDEQFNDLFEKKEEAVATSLPENVAKGKEPALRFNPVTFSFEAVDDKIRELREKRSRLKSRNDPLEAKQREIELGLEEIGISAEKMGKTGDSRTGKVTDEQRKIAGSQQEDAKEIMLRKRKQRE